MLRSLAFVVGLCAAAAFEFSATYARFESGVCPTHEGWAQVDTPEECAQAAPHVGAQKCQGCVDAKEAGHGEARDDRPGGCRAHAKDFCCAHFNHNLKPETPGAGLDPGGTTGGWTAVCKKIVKDEM